MSSGAIIAGKQNRYFREFIRAGATGPERAKRLEEIGCRRSILFDRMVARGVFVQTPDGRHYIDLARAEEFRARRRTRALIAVIVALTLMVIIFWLR